MMKTIKNEEKIRSIVKASIEKFATDFQMRHIEEVDDPEGTINMKIHNVFISVLGKDIQYYTALCRSLDSTLGNMLEKCAMNIAKLFYIVKNNVEGPLNEIQTNKIAELLEQYKRHVMSPSIKDYEVLRIGFKVSSSPIKRHDSDYYLIDKETNNHYLIELKIGGDLDNKKARSEKEAILEQYAILSNTLSKTTKIYIFFATAYNRFGEENPWQQERVLQFFAKEELLIGEDFWNFICKSDSGYYVILDEYRKNAHVITDALDRVKRVYL